MKVIKTAAMVVGAVALVASGVGAIAGGMAFAAATGVSLATVTAIGTVAGLVSTVANAISPPKAPRGTVGGQQTEFKLDMNGGLPYTVGRTFVGGNVVHRDTWGKDNQYQGFVVTYSAAGTFQGFESVLIDQNDYGRAGDAIGGTYNGWLWNRLTLPGTPAAPVTSPVPGFPGLDADFRLSGHATGVLVARFDLKEGKKFGTGIPKNGVVGWGERVYDARQDSTYPGGNGPCRAGIEATYVGGAAAENPWCHALTWALGRWQNGKRVMGVGQSLSSIDVQAYVDAANVADANGWKVGGQVFSVDNKWEVLKMMAQAGGGRPLRLGARLSCYVNAPRVALATILESDLVGRMSVATTQTYRDRINGLIPRYRSEAHGWEMVPASVVRVASYVAVDGEEKTREWPFPLVQNLKQASQLGAYELVNRREFGPITAPVFLRFMGYRPGDALNLRVPNAGLVDQLAIVHKRQIDPVTGDVQLAMMSETTAKHAFALGHTSVAPPIPNLTVPDESVVAAPQASDWDANGGELENAGVKTPAVILTGDVRNPNAEGFLVEVRPVDAAEWSMVGQYPAKTTRVDIVGVAAGASYYVGVSFVRRGVVGERLQLDPVKAGPLVAGAAQSLPGDGTIGGALDPVTGVVVGGVRVFDLIEDVGRIPGIGQSIIDLDAAIDRANDAAAELRDDLGATNAALDAVDRLAVGVDNAQRQASRDLGRLDEAVVRALLEGAATREIIRDAGIVVDPANGTAKIWAIDQLADRVSRVDLTLDAQAATIRTKASVDLVNELISMAVLDPEQAAQLEPIIARLTTVETLQDGFNAVLAQKAEAVELTRVSGVITTVSQSLEALAGVVFTKAETTKVDALGVRLGAAEQILSALPDVASYSVELRSARSAIQAGEEATVRGLLAADKADQRQFEQLATFRQEAFTRIVEGLSAEAVSRLQLSAVVAANRATALQEVRALADADKAAVTAIDALKAENAEQSAAIGTVRDLSVGIAGGVAGLNTTIRQVDRRADAAQEAVVRSMLDADKAGQAVQRDIAQIAVDFRTTFLAGEAASAVAQQALLARIRGNEASVIVLQKTVADATSAISTTIAALDAVVKDPATGLPATRAQMTAIDKARADGDRASLEAVEALSAEIFDGPDGLPSVIADVSSLRDAVAAGDAANARSIDAVRATVNDPATGLPGAFAAVQGASQASADRDEAIGRRVDGVSAAVGDVSANIERVADAVVTGDRANAQLIEAVRLKLGDLGEATVKDLIQITVDEVDKIRATRTIAIDINGNVVGTQLVGSEDGRGTLGLINADLAMGTGRIIYASATVMMVAGIGFGKNQNLLEWFGPRMAIADCTTANATSYKTITGDERMGGTLSGGIIKNAVQTTNPNAGASVSTGKVRSNGRRRTIVLSYSYYRAALSNQNANPREGQISAEIRLYRGAALIATLQAAGSFSLVPFAGSSNPAQYSEDMGGTLTTTDDSGGNEVEYTATLITRTLGPGPAGVVSSDVIGQNITIVQTEE